MLKPEEREQIRENKLRETPGAFLCRLPIDNGCKLSALLKYSSFTSNVLMHMYINIIRVA